jgi:hypothetical protein
MPMSFHGGADAVPMTDILVMLSGAVLLPLVLMAAVEVLHGQHGLGEAPEASEGSAQA